MTLSFSKNKNYHQYLVVKGEYVLAKWHLDQLEVYWTCNYGRFFGSLPSLQLTYP